MTSLKIHKWRQTVLAAGRVPRPLLRETIGGYGTFGGGQSYSTLLIQVDWVSGDQCSPVLPVHLRFQGFSKTPYSRAIRCRAGCPTPAPPHSVGKKG